MNKEMMIALGQSVKGFIAKSFEPLIKRIEDLEAKEPIKGIDGQDGVDGQDGTNGVDGESAFILACKNGFAGTETEWLASLKGIGGQDGTNGEDGARGQSAYDLACTKGFEGSEVEWLNSLMGTKGADGVDGQDGINGENGRDGVDGQDGNHGKSAYELACDKGFDGSDVDWLNSLIGTKGADGINGTDGQNGSNGVDGKDAIEIDVLPSINPEKTYPRGTYAHADGGVVRAFRNTEQLDGELVRCGWDVVVDGIKSINITNNGRDFSIEIAKTSGQQAIQTFSLPVMLYMGVFKQDCDYQKGDVVTWAGSTWHCNAPTKDKPGESTSWTLMVKKGRDGKDGRNGQQGEKGIAGSDGRDHMGLHGIGNIK